MRITHIGLDETLYRGIGLALFRRCDMANHGTMRQADVEGKLFHVKNFNVLDIVECDNLKEIERSKKLL